MRACVRQRLVRGMPWHGVALGLGAEGCALVGLLVLFQWSVWLFECFAKGLREGSLGLAALGGAGMVGEGWI
ncbi:hypothetical protein BC567DRAFT_227555 [Phyllosticta citribraziliensis]